MTALDLQSCTAGRWQGEPPLMISGIATDTRRLHRGDAFVALRGPNFDGHAFAAEAARLGASVLIGDADGFASCKDITTPLLLVDDSLKALGDIAARWRSSLRLPVVAITGSYGKTTLRSMLEHVLTSKGMRVTATRSNDNNLIGVPQTLMRISPSDDVAVIECGISEPGEMHRLANMVRPDVAVITGVAAAHAEGLGDLAGVAAEKAILLDALTAGGCGILGPGVSALLGSLRMAGEAELLDMDADDAVGAVDWQMDGNTIVLSRCGESAQFDVPLPAIHWAQNAALAATVLHRLDLASLTEVGKALQSWQPVGGRMHSLEGVGGSTLLDDSYNANPASMQAALNTLRRMPGRRIAVLGDMAELGRDSAALHAGLDIHGLDAVLLVGDEMRALARLHNGVHHVVSVEQALQEVLAMHPHKGDTLLIKGSRCMRMEQVVDGLREVGDAV